MNKIPFFLFDRFLRTDTSYLARGSFWQLIGQFAGLAIAFLLSILYAQFLSKEIYGSYRYIISILGIMNIFALSDMSTTIVRSIARGFDGTFRKAMKIVFLSSLAIPLAGAGIAFFFIRQGSPGIAIGILFASLLAPFSEGLSHWRAYYNGMREFQKKTMRTLIVHATTGITMTGTVLFLFATSPGASYAIVLLTVAALFSQAAPNIVFFLRILRRIPKDAPVEPGSIAYGIHSSVATIPSTIAFSIDSILLHAFLGPAALAVYAFAIVMPEQIKAFAVSITEVAFPKIAHKMADPEQHRALQCTLVPKIWRAMIGTAALVALYIAAAPFIYHLFFPQYADAIPFTRVYALPLILLPFSVLDKTLKAEGNIKKIYFFNISSPVIQIGALALLIPLFGIWGAIAGRMIGRILNYILLFILFKMGHHYGKS